MKAAGAALTEVPKAWGNALRFTLPGTHRQWTLTPQVNLENSRPDFVLETNDTAVPTVAIFTDGRAFHAVSARNRLADDAEKREILRGTGRIVLAITAQDISDAERKASSDPAWYSPTTVTKLIKMPQFLTTPSAYEGLRSGPISWLLNWVSAPNPTEIGIVARAVPMFFSGKQYQHKCADELSLAAAGRAVLLSQEMPHGDRVIVVRQFGAFALVAEPSKTGVEVALVLDDRDSVLDSAHADAWRLWLQLSNALALRDWSTVITTTSRVGAPTVMKPEETPGAATLPTGLDFAWTSAFELATPGTERNLVRELAERGGLEAPTIGAEGPQGIPLDISWPSRHVAVALHDMPDEDRDELTASGWHVVRADPDAVVAALSAQKNNAGITDSGEL